MSSEDLVFNILTRGDQRAARALKNMGDAADHTAGRFIGLSKAAAALGSLPALGATATGALLAMPAAATAGAAALGVLAVAMHGVADAFKSGRGIEGLEFQGLAHSAAAFVVEGRRVNEVLTGWKRSVQQEFFAPLEGTFDRLANRYMPVLQARVPALAADFGRLGRSLTVDLTSDKSIANVATILDSARFSTASLGRTLSSTLGLFIDLGAAGSRAWEKIAGNLASGTEGLRQFFAAARSNGSLDQLFSTATASLQSLMRAIAPLGAALYNLFAAQGTARAAENLFTILGTGTRILAGLINAFASLPSGVQSSLLTLGALGFVAGKTFTAVRELAAGMAVTSVALQTLGGAGAAAGAGLATASTALSRMAGPIGLAVAAVAFLAVTMSKADDETKPLERDLSRLIDTTRTWVASGKAVGEFAKTTGGSLQALAARTRATENEMKRLDDIAKSNSLESYDEFVRNSSKSMATLQVEADRAANALTRARRQNDEDINKIADTTAQLARNGDIKAAAILYQQFNDAFVAQGKDAAWVNGKMQAYLDITGGVTIAQLDMAKGASENARQTTLLAGSWVGAINKLGSLKQAFDEFNGVALTYDRAMNAAEAAVDTLTDSIIENGATLDRNSEAGRRNREALDSGIEKAAAAAQAEYDHAIAIGKGEDAVANARAVWNTYRDDLRATAIAHGLNAKMVDAFLDEIAKMPQFVAVPISTPGVTESDQAVKDLEAQIKGLTDRQIRITDDTPDARRRFDELQAQIDALHGKEVQIRTTIWEQRNYVNGTDFRDTHGRALGGIDLKMANGGMAYTSQWLRSPTILAGERGDEAYLALNAPKARTRAIARDVVDNHLGGPEALWPEMGGGAGTAAALSQLAAAVAALAGQRVRAEVVVSGGSSPMEQLIVRLLRDFIHSQGGSVQSALGS